MKRMFEYINSCSDAIIKYFYNSYDFRIPIYTG